MTRHRRVPVQTPLSRFGRPYLCRSATSRPPEALRRSPTAGDKDLYTFGLNTMDLCPTSKTPSKMV